MNTNSPQKSDLARMVIIVAALIAAGALVTLVVLRAWGKDDAGLTATLSGVPGQVVTGLFALLVSTSNAPPAPAPDAPQGEGKP